MESVLSKRWKSVAAIRQRRKDTQQWCSALKSSFYIGRINPQMGVVSLRNTTSLFALKTGPRIYRTGVAVGFIDVIVAGP